MRRKHSEVYTADQIADALSGCPLGGYRQYGMDFDLYAMMDFGLTVKVSCNIPGKTSTKVSLRSGDGRLNLAYKLDKDAYKWPLRDILYNLTDAEPVSAQKGSWEIEAPAPSLDSFTVLELLEEVHSRTTKLLNKKKAKAPSPPTNNVVNIIDYVRNMVAKEVA